jgi:hypothetical protein
MRIPVWVFSAAMACGCGVFCTEHETAVCGEPPAEAIHRLRVAVTTGAEATDMNIFFCLLRHGAEYSECTQLDRTFANDFESWQTDEFEFVVDPALEPGQLERFYIHVGDASLFDDSWEIAGLVVHGLFADGTPVLLYEEPQIDCHDHISDDGVYRPAACDY